MTLLKSQTQGGDSDQAPSQKGDSNRLKVAFETISGQLPSDAELSDLLHGLNSFREIYREDMEGARAMTADLSSSASTLSDTALRSDADRIELAALTMVVNALFSLDTAKTRE